MECGAKPNVMSKIISVQGVIGKTIKNKKIRIIENKVLINSTFSKKYLFINKTFLNYLPSFAPFGLNSYYLYAIVPNKNSGHLNHGVYNPDLS